MLTEKANPPPRRRLPLALLPVFCVLLGLWSCQEGTLIDPPRDLGHQTSALLSSDMTSVGDSVYWVDDEATFFDGDGIHWRFVRSIRGDTIELEVYVDAVLEVYASVYDESGLKATEPFDDMWIEVDEVGLIIHSSHPCVFDPELPHCFPEPEANQDCSEELQRVRDAAEEAAWVIVVGAAATALTGGATGKAALVSVGGALVRAGWRLYQLGKCLEGHMNPPPQH